jgi:large subunit ribosomal protein L25
VEGDTKGKRHVLVQEIQKHPVVERVLHVDFFEIELDQAIDFTVPLRFTGVARGVDLGGELQAPMNQVTLHGCPLDIPDEIVVDITELERGGTPVTCGDLEIPSGVTLKNDAAARCVYVI